MTFLTSLTGFLGGFMVNPALLLLGVAAIVSPIIIHLLNKRKFTRVEWAAMDFLLEADKKNRRRVRLENLLLLLLRCLICILIGLLIARPFRSLGLTVGLFDAEEFERIVLLDDSLSMSVKQGASSSMGVAKETLIDFVRGLANNGSKDHLTLYVTSDPTRPIFNAELIDEQKAEEIAADIEEYRQVSDQPANLSQALLEVEKGLQGNRGPSLNRIVYVISDMRNRDWPVESTTADDENAVSTTLRRISEDTSGAYLVDVGRQEDVGNIYVEYVRSKEKSLVAGVVSDFEVAVRNTGSRDVDDVKVQFIAAFSDGGESKLDIEIPKVPAGESVTTDFKFAFQRDELASGGSRTRPTEIRAVLLPVTSVEADELPEDNTRFFAAHVVSGIRTLIVDGDRSPSRHRSESFFLNKALSPPGSILSGVSVDVVGEAEFETLRLDEYQVIYLCNLYRIPDAGEDIPGASEGAGASANNKRLSRREELEKWVSEGGGLVVALGDRLDEDVYNRELYRDGKGLLPFKLETILGDVEEEAWVHFNVEQPHPVMTAFEGENSEFAEYVKVFRWWDCVLNQADVSDGKVNVIGRYTNTDRSPAVVEKKFGDGRILAFTSPLDADWNDWPQDYSFVPTIQVLNKYMARQTADDANVQVGDTLHMPVDLTHYELEVSVSRPEGPSSEAEVSPADQASGERVMYNARYNQVDHQGFYEMILNRREGGGTEPVLFGANIDSREGDLKRADIRSFQRKFGDAKVEFISKSDLLSVSVDQAKLERWRWVLAGLVVALCLEQFLGWRFGRGR